MDAKTINQTYDLLALAQGDTRLKRSGSFYIGPCPFCGGLDRFNLKHTPDGWRWYCRKCGDGKYHTSIDYLMRRDNLDFLQAFKALGGEGSIRPRQAVAPIEPEITLPAPAWQAKRWREVDTAAACLLSDVGRPGRLYLTERRVSTATIESYLLGYDPGKYDTTTKQRRPAIVMPWFDSGPDGHTLTAIKYRFVDQLAGDPGHRYTSQGRPILYGLQIAGGHNVLILVEGEINAMSLTQASAQDLLDIDALSFGSESGGRASVLQHVARDYRRVIVWADDPEKADAIRSSLARPADALCSPVIDGHKYDANALLQKVWLGAFLRKAVYPLSTAALA